MTDVWTYPVFSCFLYTLKITGSKRKADVCLGSCQAPGDNTVVVSEQWVIGTRPGHFIFFYIINQLFIVT